jgi:nucleotide-binding universal stress UspA family protein
MFSRILMAYNGTRECRAALDECGQLAAVCEAEVHLLAVAHLSLGEALAEAATTTGLPGHQQHEMQQILAEGADHLRQLGVAVESSLVWGDPVKEIHAAALALGADLIVIGHRKRKPFSRLWKGSVGAAIVCGAPCDVLVTVPESER